MMDASALQLPLWAEIVTSVFAVLGALVALLGATGLLRLGSFFARVHAPAVITTVGVWLLMLATLTYFSAQTGKFAVNILLLGLLIGITAPVTTILLMRAALFRSRQRGEDVPRSVNMLELATPKMAPEKDDVDPEEQARAEARRARKAKQAAGGEVDTQGASTLGPSSVIEESADETTRTSPPDARR